MAGLVPAIHVLYRGCIKEVDARHEVSTRVALPADPGAGHDAV